jgi:hypothetical protein
MSRRYNFLAVLMFLAASCATGQIPPSLRMVEIPPAPQPARQLDDAASGVPLAAAADTLAEQAAAYRACAERNEGWLKYKAEVDAEREQLRRILKGQT